MAIPSRFAVTIETIHRLLDANKFVTIALLRDRPMTVRVSEPCLAGAIGLRAFPGNEGAPQAPGPSAPSQHYLSPADMLDALGHRLDGSSRPDAWPCRDKASRFASGAIA